MQASTVVGYMANSAIQGYNLGVAQFANVAKTDKSIRLGDIVPQYADGSAVPDLECQITLQTFDSGANAADYYYWCGPDDDPDTYPVLGWYNYFTDEAASEVILPQGAGYMFFSPAEDNGIKFLVSGQVVETTGEVHLKNGYQLMGNVLPKTIKLGQIVPKYADGSELSDLECQVTLQTFDSGANAADYYYWCGPDDDPDTYPVLGWYNYFTDESAADVDFTAGKGFMIFTPAEDDATVVGFPDL